VHLFLVVSVGLPERRRPSPSHAETSADDDADEPREHAIPLVQATSE